MRFSILKVLIYIYGNWKLIFWQTYSFAPGFDEPTHFGYKVYQTHTLMLNTTKMHEIHNPERISKHKHSFEIQLKTAPLAFVKAALSLDHDSTSGLPSIFFLLAISDFMDSSPNHRCPHPLCGHQQQQALCAKVTARCVFNRFSIDRLDD